MDSRLHFLSRFPSAFRPYESREYQDTYPVPPPSAVFGMLLSLCGVPREEIPRHRGVAMSLAVEGAPGRCKVFRKLRCGKELDDIRPDYQDLLIGLRLWVWLADGHDAASPTLCVRVANALSNPRSVARFGGLSLGESSYLVDSISEKALPPEELVFLVPDDSGFHSLPVWVHHAANTSLRRRFDLREMSVVGRCRRLLVSYWRSMRRVVRRRQDVRDRVARAIQAPAADGGETALDGRNRLRCRKIGPTALARGA